VRKSLVSNELQGFFGFLKYGLDFHGKDALYFGMIKQHRSLVSGVIGCMILAIPTFLFANNPDPQAFPTTGLLPKAEIGALDFLKEHPEADGRGVIVAILDTGVDPGAPGLSKTTTGEPKLLAVIDATGSGDVPTTTVQKLSKEGTLVGLTGRVLNLDKTLKNPSGDCRLGMVAGYNIFPDELIERLREERQEDWDASQRELERKLQKEVDVFKASHAEPVGADREALANLEKQLEGAVAFRKQYVDPGPVYDCVVFHDGETWRAVVDTDADGDLAEEKALAAFEQEHQYGTFGDESLLNFAVNIYNEGALLSIVADTGMHGTHVAGIVGAYFPEQPELNGVAPGAQIVSIKIGDTRLGGMETPHAMSRAVIAIKKYQCDMVNQSYGEAIRFPTGGNIIEQLTALVDDHQVVYVSSAGNDGPSLTTVGAPGGTTSALIGVGATVTPNLMKSAYSLLETMPATQFTWSSRGPTIDGDLGVDISAPGGAISPIPRWELSKNMRANGTSMAGPDACGGLALVLSALKQEHKPYTAAWVKRAAINSAAFIEGVDIFGQGHGMLQVGGVYTMLSALPASLMATPRYEISVGNNHQRGIYLRNGDLTPAKQTFSISIKAKFPEETDKEIEADFEARYLLKAKDGWVKSPEYAFVNSLDKRFEVEVNTTELAPGVHYSEVVAIDSSFPEAGPVFRIPVTVVKPTPLDSNTWEAHETLAPGVISRHFFQVPAGATWAELEVEGPAIEEPVTLVVHPQHIIPGERYVNVGASYYLGVSKDRPRSKTFPVMEGATMELTFAQYWSELKSAGFEFELKFHGLKTELGDGVYAQGDKGEEFRVLSLLESSLLEPSAQFTQLRRSIAAESASLYVETGDRDQLEKDGEAYHSLVLQYAFSLSEDADVTPLLSMLNDKIYEVEFESQLQMVFDANKQLIATDDTFPESMHLKKGDYVLRLQLRHKDRAALEMLKTLDLTLAIDLAKPIGVSAYEVTDAALLQDGDNGETRLAKNTRAPLVLAEPDAGDIPDYAVAGDRLTGALQLQDDSPVNVPIQWVYQGKMFEEKAAESTIKAADPSPEEAVADAVIALASQYRKDKNKVAFDQLMKQHLEKSPRPLEVALEQLHWSVDSDEKGELSTLIKKQAKAVLDLVDEDAVAKYFGLNHEVTDAASKALDDKMNQSRDALIEAYGALAMASCKGNSDVETLKQDYAHLKAWIEVGKIDTKVRRALFEKQGFQGEVLALLNKAIEDDVTDKTSYENRIQLLEQLGWQHVVKYEKDWMLRRFPADYAVF